MSSNAQTQYQIRVNFYTSSTFCTNLKVWVKLYNKYNHPLKVYNSQQSLNKKTGMQNKSRVLAESLTVMGTNAGK